MKRNIITAIVLALCGTIYAQKDSLNAVIHVENEYTPVVTKAVKRGFTPSTEENNRQTPLELEFSHKSNPFKGFTSERDVKELLPGQKQSYPGYVRLGYGTGNNADALASYMYDITKRDKIKAVASIKGYNRELKSVTGKWDSRMYSSWVSTDYSHRFDNLLLGATATFENDVFNYNTNIPTDKQNNKRFDVGTYGVSSLAGPLAYEFKAGFARNHYSRQIEEGSCAENRIYAGGKVKYEFGEEGFNNINLGVNLNNYIYDNYSIMKNFLSADFNPYTDILTDNIRIHIGANVNLLTANGPLFAIAPDLGIEATISNSVALYGTVKGNRRAGTFDVLMQQNPYNILFTTDKPEYTIADVTIGTRITNNNLSIDIFAGGAYTKDAFLAGYLPLEIPQTPTHSDKLVASFTEQENTTNIYAGTRVGYDYEGWLKTSGMVRYNYRRCDEDALLMMKPEFEFSLNAEARFLEDFYVTLAYNFATYKHDTPSLNKNELNLRTSYKFMERFGAYIEGNNLLNRNYFKYAGYNEQGINILLGLSAAF